MQPDHGRSSARHSRDARTARRVRRRRTSPARAIGYVLVAALAVSSAAFGINLALGTHGSSQQAYASDGSRVPLLGSSVLSKADLARDTAEFGRMPIVRVYYGHLPDANAWTTGMAAANHSAVVVSFKALPREILSGADDASLRHFFDTAPRGRPIYYAYFHEPEDNIGAHEFTLADYKAAWARVVAIADAAHNPDLHSTLILMSWDLVRASHRNWRDYLPGGGIISTLGWDAYPTGSATNQNPQLQPPTAFMGPAIAASKSVGLPYAFPEFGLSRANGRPAWLAQVGKYILHSGALFATLFNGNHQYPTLRLTDPASVAIWRSFVAVSRAGTPVPAPSGTPTPAPTGTGTPPAPSSAIISGLTLNPSAIAPNGQSHATLTFTLAEPANVTVCVLDARGRVARLLARPSRRAGRVTIRYFGFTAAQRQLPSGRYTLLVVASNARGSGTAEAALTIGTPRVPQ